MCIRDRHSDGYGAAPQWLPYPRDVNALLPQLWASGVGKDADGVLTVAGVPVTQIAAEHGTPAYVVDEADFRARARAFRDEVAVPFADIGGLDVYYAGKAFLCSVLSNGHSVSFRLRPVSYTHLDVYKRQALL